MQDEVIDIISNDLSFVKTALKSEAHKHGWLHASIHVWFYTDSGELLFQKRSPNKIAFPSLWDVSVAGHIGESEKPIDSAIREVEEEIGLKIITDNLHFIGVFKELYQHKINFIDNEIHYIYITALDYTLNNLSIQKEELTDLKLVSISEFEKELQNQEFSKTFVPHAIDYYNFILSEIKKVQP
jgi:isopentenyl-diphosphate delta-isomerase